MTCAKWCTRLPRKAGAPAGWARGGRAPCCGAGPQEAERPPPPCGRAWKGPPRQRAPSRFHLALIVHSGNKCPQAASTSDYAAGTTARRCGQLGTEVRSPAQAGRGTWPWSHHGSIFRFRRWSRGSGAVPCAGKALVNRESPGLPGSLPPPAQGTFSRSGKWSVFSKMKSELLHVGKLK